MLRRSQKSWKKSHKKMHVQRALILFDREEWSNTLTNTKASIRAAQFLVTNSLFFRHYFLVASDGNI